MRVNKLYLKSLALAACAWLAASSAAHAAPVSYTIDSSQSSLQLVLDFLGSPSTPQVAGGDVDSMSGTINADLTAGVLTFSGGSVIAADLNPAGPFLPANTHTVPNYGMFNGLAGDVALGDFTYDIVAGTVTNGAPPAGMDWAGAGLVASALVTGPLSGTDPNYTLANASLTTVGNVETLFIPMLIDNQAPGTTEQIRFRQIGQIVATRVVAEPSTLVMTGLGLVGLAVVVRKRRGK